MLVTAWFLSRVHQGRRQFVVIQSLIGIRTAEPDEFFLELRPSTEVNGHGNQAMGALLCFSNRSFNASRISA